MLSDDLSQSLDYSEFLASIRETVLKNNTMKLLETLVTTVGDTLIKRFAKVELLEISARKASLPHRLTQGAKVSVIGTFARS